MDHACEAESLDGLRACCISSTVRTSDMSRDLLSRHGEPAGLELLSTLVYICAVAAMQMQVDPK